MHGCRTPWYSTGSPIDSKSRPSLLKIRISEKFMVATRSFIFFSIEICKNFLYQTKGDVLRKPLLDTGVMLVSSFSGGTVMVSPPATKFF